MINLQCGQISIEEFGFLKRNFYVKTRAGFMETLYGKVSAPNAGERDHVQLEPQDKTQGNIAGFRSLRLTEALTHLYFVCG